jgi:hypothetical protein
MEKESCEEYPILLWIIIIIIINYGEDSRGAYKVWVGRSMYRWKDNIRMDLQKVTRGGIDWIYVAQDRDSWRAFVNVVVKLRGP